MQESLNDHLLKDIRNLIVCHTVDEAIGRLKVLYDKSVETINKTLNHALEEDAPSDIGPKLSGATYPFLGIKITPQTLNINASKSYGVVSAAGFYGATLTRPDLFEDYYREQITSLMAHHNSPMVVGESSVPIALPFAVEHDKVAVSPEQLWMVQNNFVMPNLSTIEDAIANSTYFSPEVPKPLTLFTAERVDLSLHRLHHYTGTSVEHFQHFILLTNYQRYVDEFTHFAYEQLSTGDAYESFVEPGDYITQNPRSSTATCSGERLQYLPQMPAYHLTRPDRNGITFINIGVGPSNAKTITDHLAVLRPHCWLMVGHCAGLRRSQLLGDYVLAHAYVRADHVLDEDLPSWVPIPPIAEVQVALQQAVTRITGEDNREQKMRMRTGTVFTTDNRNWELRSRELLEQFQQSRAMAVDMESATIAANGFRFRVPYGTLLCVSDKPIHGEIKLRGMANAFYRERVKHHLQVGLEAVKILREQGVETLHSRKLRGFDDPPFR